jgi:hypothetical protein
MNDRENDLCLATEGNRAMLVSIQAVPTCSILLCVWSSSWEPNVIPHCSHLNWFADDM